MEVAKSEKCDLLAVTIIWFNGSNHLPWLHSLGLADICLIWNTSKSERIDLIGYVGNIKQECER